MNLVSADIVSILHAYYTRRSWIFLPELRAGTGYQKWAETRLDGWAIMPVPSGRFLRHTLEIKTSRSDFLRELKQPTKRRMGLLLANEFYFVTPPGIAKIEEIPPECGLIEIHQVEARNRFLLPDAVEQYFDLRTVLPAPWHDRPGPSWSFFCSAVRTAPERERTATALSERYKQLTTGGVPTPDLILEAS